MSTPRRNLDQYFTPAHATHELQRRVRIEGSVLECCSGDGGISKALVLQTGEPIITNDIDDALAADFHFDATKPDEWLVKTDWIVSNPPFNCAPQIIPLAYVNAAVGIAMLLRLSYLEPCESRVVASRRGKWLQQHPPTQLIVLPRISFTGNGKTDNVTCAWFVWDKRVESDTISFVLRSN